jgi:hypothetical protein
VVIALVALSQPRAFVWCQTETGHAALETLAAGCCGVTGPDARCFPDLAAARSRGSGDENAIGSEACRDVLVEAPTCLPPGAKLSPSRVPASRLSPVEATVLMQPWPAETRRDDCVRVAARELTLSTVLRV